MELPSLGPAVPRHHVPATTRHCDIAPASASATYRLAAIDPVVPVAETRHDHDQCEGGAVMKLLLVFIVGLLIGQSISVGIGLLVERHASPYTGLVTFIACYFTMFWVAWKLAVRITAPQSRVGDWASSEK
jgi:hypothetical protein